MSDKSNLKKIKKTAELARGAINKIKIGHRFFNVFDWGFDLAATLISIEKRLRDIEDYITAASIEINRYVKSDAHIQVTTEQSVNSNAFIGQETSKTIASEATILKENTETITSDAEVS